MAIDTALYAVILRVSIELGRELVVDVWKMQRILEWSSHRWGHFVTQTLMLIIVGHT